ncbi:hypothetical protein IV203_022408 [Nitzschia inconspicua]|uniref:Uncharacterized protein n=1 Tax=Nitzschia inconspicua TaxID=303405 RepID=A0A9K3KJI8_9STRA|nr:hypothetical protein IV203_022408 [Nitzschia inconspicua]
MVKPAVLSRSSHHRRRSPLKMGAPSTTTTITSSSSPGMILGITTLLATFLIAKNATRLEPLVACGALSSSSAMDFAIATVPLQKPSGSKPLSPRSNDSPPSLVSPMFTSFLSTNPSGIRQWGCQRNETPTIFVHLGKAGGGSNRARLAAAAQQYNRTNWFEPEKDSHFYPIPVEHSYGTDAQYRRGKFCHSVNYHHLVPDGGASKDGNVTAVDRADAFFVKKTNALKATFEGSLPCNATTPLGLAVACPQPAGRSCMGCDLRSEYCDTVYVGHNYLGSELHWLPPRYLKRWWESNMIHPTNDHVDRSPSTLYYDSNLLLDIEKTWTRLGSTAHDAVWCTDGHIVHNGRPRAKTRLTNDDPSFQKCFKTIISQADDQFRQFWQSADYSPIYASMPLLRTTMIRDPWSWLGSKFFWHHLDVKGLKCDHQHFGRWIPWAVKEYLLPFCGVDCENRWDQGLMTFEEMAVQAEGNLRQSFSVVGLLNETESFYDMVSARIGYLNLRNNPHVVGGDHQSVGLHKEEMKRCRALYLTADFQEKVKRQYPELKLMERIFEVAVEVNRFQKQELNQCR